MHKILVSVVLFAIAAPVAGQFTAPPGYATTSGGLFAYNYGLALAGSHYTSVRYQCTDSDLQMNKVAVLVKLQWRTANVTYNSQNGQGRLFTRVTLKLGHTKVQTMSNTFAQNWNGTPTTVFSGAWSQPSVLRGTPRQVWGNAGTFAFSKPMIYQPRLGLLLQEWTHDGGRLANGHTGGSPFYLDGIRASQPISSVHVYPSASGSSGGSNVPGYYFNSRGGMCNDSAIASTTYGAHAHIGLQVYSAIYLRQPNFAHKGRISSASSWYTAPSKPVVGMLSLWGSDSGVNIGARCNKLHVNPQIPMVIATKKADINGYTDWTSGGPFTNAPFVTWNDAWAGAQVYWQVAWEDSRSRSLSLSIATKLTLPKAPRAIPAGLVRSVFAYTYGAKNTRAGPFGPYLVSRNNPIEYWNAR